MSSLSPVYLLDSQGESIQGPIDFTEIADALASNDKGIPIDKIQCVVRDNDSKSKLAQLIHEKHHHFFPQKIQQPQRLIYYHDLYPLSKAHKAVEASKKNSVEESESKKKPMDKIQQLTTPCCQPSRILCFFLVLVLLVLFCLLMIFLLL